MILCRKLHLGTAKYASTHTKSRHKLRQRHLNFNWNKKDSFQNKIWLRHTEVFVSMKFDWTVFSCSYYVHCLKGHLCGLDVWHIEKELRKPIFSCCQWFSGLKTHVGVSQYVTRTHCVVSCVWVTRPFRRGVSFGVIVDPWQQPI